MKPIFGIDLTENKDNERLNSDEFVLLTAPEDRTAALEEARTDADALLTEAKLPRTLRIIRAVCGLGALPITAGIINAARKVSVAEGYHNAPYLYWIGAALVIVWAALTCMERMRSKKTLASEGAAQSMTMYDERVNDVLREMRVPQDALRVDVLCFPYTVKNGEPVAKAGALSPAKYNNIEMRAFTRDGTLRLSDLQSVYAFNLSEMREIITVRKRISMPAWNKEIAPTKGIYKPYRMTVDNVGCVYSKPYYILTLEHKSELYGLYFPCYELDAIELLTGRRAA